MVQCLYCFAEFYVKKDSIKLYFCGKTAEEVDFFEERECDKYEYKLDQSSYRDYVLSDESYEKIKENLRKKGINPPFYINDPFRNPLR